MVTPEPLPVIVLPSIPDWLPLLQPVKVPSSKPASGNASALAGVAKPATLDSAANNIEIGIAQLVTATDALLDFRPFRSPPRFTRLNIFFFLQ
jgi:hypothetical protein